MVLKEYQKRTLATVRELLERLVEWRGKATAALEVDPELDFDWVRKAWEKTVPARRYHPRRNGLDEPLPSFCLKIPTGGGKTLLATGTVQARAGSTRCSPPSSTADGLRRRHGRTRRTPASTSAPSASSRWSAPAGTSAGRAWCTPKTSGTICCAIPASAKS